MTHSQYGHGSNYDGQSIYNRRIMNNILKEIGKENDIETKKK